MVYYLLAKLLIKLTAEIVVMQHVKIEYVNRVLELARDALYHREVPIGVVFVAKGIIIGQDR